MKRLKKVSVKWIFGILVSVLGSGCQSTLPARGTLEIPEQDYPAYTLGPGDKIRLIVYEYENLSGTFTVDDLGTVALPLTGRLDIKGLTLPKFENFVTQRLIDREIINPKVSAEVVSLRPFCVLGEVRNPGCFSYVFGLTTSKAIAYAGGYSSRARKNEVVITRDDGRKVLGNHNTPVFVGDVIEVFERYF